MLQLVNFHPFCHFVFYGQFGCWCVIINNSKIKIISWVLKFRVVCCIAWRKALFTWVISSRDDFHPGMTLISVSGHVPVCVYMIQSRNVFTTGWFHPGLNSASGWKFILDAFSHPEVRQPLSEPHYMYTFAVTIDFRPGMKLFTFHPTVNEKKFHPRVRNSSRLSCKRGLSVTI